MRQVLLKIRRQDDPSDLPYWELFEIPHESGMTVSRALEVINRHPQTAEGNPTSPVLWECSCLEGMCGGCMMLIGGKVRMACTTLVDDFDGPVVVEPLSKLPVIRDLMVDRTKMQESLLHFAAWVETDAYDAPPLAARRPDEKQEEAQVFWDCNLCGACSEACPQVNARSAFQGAFIFAWTLPLQRHPGGGETAPHRLRSLAGRGGVSDCAGAENCEMVCPRGLPLVWASAVLSWDTTVSSVRRFFRALS